MEKGKKQKVEKAGMSKSKKQPFNFKTYLRDFLLFVDKKLLKTSKILLIISILLIAISIKFVITVALADECEGACMDEISIWSNYSEDIQVLGVTVISGIVPYIYAPIVGFVGCIFKEISRLAYLIKGFGYIAGIGLGIIPLILNLLVICITASLGIYICKTVTVGYRISNLNNMNFTNFRIKLFETLGKQDKVKKLKNKRDNKIKKLEKSKEKLNYVQILNVSIVVVVLQLVSVLIQHIFI